MNNKTKRPSTEAIIKWAKENNRPYPWCEGVLNHYYFNHLKEIERVEQRMKL